MRMPTLEQAQTTILGLHHISTVVADFQRTLRFYLGTLDLTLYGLPVMLDGRQSMHFHCDDHLAASPSLLSFIIDEHVMPGSIGNGQISAVTFCVPADSLSYWQRRLEDHEVQVIGRAWAFGSEHLCFRDPDGLQLALVEAPQSPSLPRTTGERRFAIQRIHAVEVQVGDLAQTSNFLTHTLGFRYVSREGPLARYSHDAMSPFMAIDVLSAPRPRTGSAGAGVINDVVWRVPDVAMLEQIVRAVKHAGQDIVFQSDRKDYRAVYFRDPCGINFAAALSHQP